MWKKLHRPRDAPSPSADEKAGDRQPNTGQEQPEDSSPGLPPLPLSMEPESSAEPRVTSSIYSRPSTFIDTSGQSNDPYKSTVHESKDTDVSPPVSPLQGSQHKEDGGSEVSPIDETPGTFDQFRQPEKKPASSLPVPKKDVNLSRPREDEPPAVSQKQPQVKNKRPSDAAAATKWDDFSGEPTTNDKGKAALATPGNVSQPTKPSSHKSQFSILNKGRELNKAGKKLLETRRHHHEDDPAKSPPPRQPWKGQSGRSAIVNPVQTKKDARVHPVTVPPRKGSRGQTGHQSTTSSSSQASTSRPKAEENITPAVPPKDSVSSDGSKTPTGTVRTERQSSVDWSKQPDSKTKSLPTPRDEPTPEGNKAAESDANFTANFGDFSLDQQPASRFSVTTCATTEAGSRPASPKDPNTDKDVPPLPPLPKEALSRATPSTKVATRKPTPSEIPNVKTLPRSPEEEGASNRIDALKARLKDLSRRRGNVDTIINELTQVIQPSSIAYDMATRGEVKKTVDSLNDELAEIKKEEHDIGMKLLRAYKKQDEDDFYQESSVLWIKRLAS